MEALTKHVAENSEIEKESVDFLQENWSRIMDIVEDRFSNRHIIVLERDEDGSIVLYNQQKKKGAVINLEEDRVDSVENIDIRNDYTSIESDRSFEMGD